MGTKLIAKTNIRLAGHHSDVKTDEAFEIDATTASTLVAQGHASIAAESTPVGIEALSSEEITARLAQIQERRESRRDSHAEARALQVAAEHELADLEDRQVRGGEDVAKEIGLVEAQIAELGRQIRARATALEREIDETVEAKAALEAALPVAQQREIDARWAIIAADLDERLLAARRRTAAALSELCEAQLAEGDLDTEQRELSAKASRETKRIMIGRSMIVADFTVLSPLISLFAEHGLTRDAGVVLRRHPRNPYLWTLVPAGPAAS